MNTAKEFIFTEEELKFFIISAKYASPEVLLEIAKAMGVKEVAKLPLTNLKKELEEANKTFDKVAASNAPPPQTIIKEKLKPKPSRKKSGSSPEAQKTAELTRKALFEAADNDNWKLAYLDEKVKGHTNPAYLLKDGKFITGEICDKEVVSSASPLMLWSLAKGHYDALKEKYPNVIKKVMEEQLLLKKNKESNHGS